MNEKIIEMIKISEQKSLIEFLSQLQKQLEDYDDDKDYDYICGARDILNLIIDKIKI